MFIQIGFKKYNDNTFTFDKEGTQQLDSFRTG